MKKYGVRVRRSCSECDGDVSPKKQCPNHPRAKIIEQEEQEAPTLNPSVELCRENPILPKI